MKGPLVVASITALLAVPLGFAHALVPHEHERISQASCVTHGLPSRFCWRLAQATANVDAREFDDLSAHAQTPAGTDVCTAANQTVARIHARGVEALAGIAALREDALAPTLDIARPLGEVLHAMQDHCAHEGMTNAQHAWYSLGEFCDRGQVSPDNDESAIECAERETDAAMEAVAAALGASGISSDRLGGAVCLDSLESECGASGLPSPRALCHFLAESHDWDGVETRWDASLVAPVLRTALFAGLAGDSEFASDLCRDGLGMTSSPDESVDVSDGAPSCKRASLICLGKVDLRDYFADQVLDEPTDQGGCAVAGGGATSSLLVLLAFALKARTAGRAPRTGCRRGRDAAPHAAAVRHRESLTRRLAGCWRAPARCSTRRGC